MRSDVSIGSTTSVDKRCGVGWKSASWLVAGPLGRNVVAFKYMTRIEVLELRHLKQLTEDCTKRTSRIPWSAQDAGVSLVDVGMENLGFPRDPRRVNWVVV